jgi:hypothetical protein
VVSHFYNARLLSSPHLDLIPVLGLRSKELAFVVNWGEADLLPLKNVLHLNDLNLHAFHNFGLHLLYDVLILGHYALCNIHGVRLHTKYERSHVEVPEFLLCSCELFELGDLLILTTTHIVHMR